VPGLRLPRPDGATPAQRRKWALIAVVLVAAAVTLLVLNGGRLARSVGLAGEPGTATVTDCHQYGGPKHRNFLCHGDFHGADGTVRRGVEFEDTYEHDVGRGFDVRFDGEAAVSITDITIAQFAPALCALAIALLALAAMLLVLAIGGRPDAVWRRYRYAGFGFLGGLVLTVASFLVQVFSVMSPNL
jgi:hypothetical protein